MALSRCIPRRWSIALLALHIVGLVACGGGADAPAAGAAPPPAPPAASSPAPTPTPAGVPIGAAASATIGAAGGSLASGDGMVRLTIPAGALAAPTEVSIEPISNLAHGGIGAAYRLRPEGQVFQQPVLVSFGYTDSDLAGTAAPALGIAYQDGRGFWRGLKNVVRDAAARTLTVSTTHFSDWSRVSGLQIRPPSKTIRSDESVDLVVAFCEPQTDPNDDLTTLLSLCTSGGPIVWPVKNWSVDGQSGGSFDTGIVTADARGDGARYQGPIVLDGGGQTHDVSVEVDLPGAEKTLLVAQITVADYPQVWEGRSSGTLAFGAIFRTANDAQWHSPELADDGRVRYRFRGEVSALLPPDPTGCTVAPLSNAGLPATIQVSYLSIDYRQAPPRYEVSGTSWWEVQTTCPPPLPSGASLMEAVWLSGNSLDKAPAFGELSGNGSKIEGGGASPGGNWHWCFVAKGSAASCPP